MKPEQLFAGCTVTGSAGTEDIRSVVSDSRKVRPGSLFVCLHGQERDGHAYAAEALQRGAVRILAEHPVDGIPADRLLLTPCTRTAEAWIWHNFTGRPTDGMKTVAVTGTAGKTTIVLLLAAIFRAAGYRVGFLSTVRAQSGERELSLGACGGSSVTDRAGAMTTPDPEYFFGAAEQMRQDGCDIFLYEASSQALALHKLDPVWNDAAVFTALSREHLDFHGTMEAYFQAKAGLMARSRLAVVQADDPYMARLPGLYPQVPAVRCSVQPEKAAVSDACALRYRPHGADGLEYVYFSEKAVFRIRSPLLGQYSVSNTLQAAACALALGVSPSLVRETLAGCGGAEGRLYAIPLGNAAGKVPRVYLDYAHTPAALTAVLTALRETVCGRLFVVCGCGGERDRGKRPLMVQAAQNGADFTVLTSDNPRRENPAVIFADMLGGLDGAKPWVLLPDRREAIRYALGKAAADDLVLLAGKGHERYEITADGRHPLDEEAIVRDFFGAGPAAPDPIQHI